MLKEYDTVILQKILDDVALPLGTKGVVLMVFDSSPKAYEVEFVDSANQSLGTFTVSEEHIAVWIV